MSHNFSLKRVRQLLFGKATQPKGEMGEAFLLEQFYK